MQPKKFQWRLTLISALGGLMAISGAVLAICWDDIFHMIIAKELKISPTARGYAMWQKLDIPLHLDIYFFNWTNSEDFLNTTTKPNFVELGPYRFRETKEKVNVTWHPENSTVSYRQLRRWYFDEGGSKGRLDDNITTLNVVAASAVYAARSWTYLRQKGVSMGLAMFHQTVAVTRTAGELLFDGYTDPLLDLAHSLPASASGGAPPHDKFGWFYMRNGSTENDGLLNVGTGADDISNLGRVMSWNYEAQNLKFEPPCSQVVGSSGEFYTPRLSAKKKISMFSPDLCRTLTFDFEQYVKVREIRALKFTGGSSIMDNGSYVDANKCFCPGECQPSGTANVSSCRFGSPAFVSFPHFYKADQYYSDAVDGLEPSQDKHEFFMSIEPTTGIPLDVAARFQLNILVAPSSNVVLYSKVPKVFLPILWFEQRVTLNETLAADLKLLLSLPFYGNIGALVIFFVGIVILLWNPVRINIRACLRKRRESVVAQDVGVPLNNTTVATREKATLPQSAIDKTVHERCDTSQTIPEEEMVVVVNNKL